MEKDIKNTNIVACKFRPASINIINQSLKVAKKKKQKRKKIMKKQKTKAMATKCKKARRVMSLSSEKKENYKNNTKDETNID